MHLAQSCLLILLIQLSINPAVAAVHAALAGQCQV